MDEYPTVPEAKQVRGMAWKLTGLKSRHPSVLKVGVGKGLLSGFALSIHLWTMKRIWQLLNLRGLAEGVVLNPPPTTALGINGPTESLLTLEMRG